MIVRSIEMCRTDCRIGSQAVRHASALRGIILGVSGGVPLLGRDFVIRNPYLAKRVCTVRDLAGAVGGDIKRDFAV